MGIEAGIPLIGQPTWDPRTTAPPQP